MSSPSSLPLPSIAATPAPPIIPESHPVNSVGLAVGLVLCPIAFIFIVVAFWRVSRRGELCPRPPTARLRQEEERQRRDYAKFMSRARASQPPSPLLPMYTPSFPPPAHITGSNPSPPPYA